MKLGLGLALPLYKKKGVSSFNPLSYNPALWLKADAGLVTDGAASFAAASSQYLSRADNADLSVGDIDFWWAGWAYLNSVAVDSRALVGKQDGSELEYLLLYEVSVNRFRFVVSFDGGTGAGLSQVDSGSAVSATTWYFVVAYHDSVNNSIGISVNGGSFATTGHTGGVFNGSTEFRLGARANAGTALYLDGRLDSVAFGKSPVGGIAGLATTIRDSLYNSGAGKRRSDLSASEKTNWGLVSFWDFASPSAGLVADSQGSNTLTNNNGVTFAAGIVSGQATADGDPVTKWEDQSGNNRDATQATASKRPVLKLAIQNGLPVVRGDGVDDTLALSNFLSGFAAGEILMVVRTTNDPALGSNGLDQWGTAVTSEASYYPWTDGVIYDKFGSTVRKVVSNPAPSLTQFHIYGRISAANSWVGRLDGVQIFSTGTNTVGWTTSPAIFGSSDDGSTINRFFSGDIGEILLFSSVLSDADRQAVETYLNDRWGIY